MPGHVPGLRASAEMEEGEVNEMNTKKMAIVGTGLVVAGVGLGQSERRCFCRPWLR